MARLKKDILDLLVNRTGLTERSIRNRISEIKRENALLTLNAAAQVFGQKKGVSFMPKLSPEDRRSLGLYQQAKNITNTVNNTYNTKHDNRHVSVMGETFNNLIIGDNNSGNRQQIGILEGALSDFLEKVAGSNNLTPEEKNDIAAEIGTIASQSKKAAPDKSTIQRAWAAISVLSKIAGLASSVATVGQILHKSSLI